MPAFLVPGGVKESDHAHVQRNDGTCSRCRRAVRKDSVSVMLWSRDGNTVWIFCDDCTGREQRHVARLPTLHAWFPRGTRWDDISCPFNAIWIVRAPWAHPDWNDYAFRLYDLTTKFRGREAFLLQPGMTHEFICHALDPDRPIPNITEDPATWTFAPLSPANMGYQFNADSDTAAKARIQELVQRVEAKRLSPDTDYRHLWNAEFADGAAMVKNLLTGE